MWTLPPGLTIDDILEVVRADGLTGFCLACGADKDMVEPDAQNYPCDECKELQVFGAEFILIGIDASL